MGQKYKTWLNFESLSGFMKACRGYRGSTTLPINSSVFVVRSRMANAKGLSTTNIGPMLVSLNTDGGYSRRFGSFFVHIHESVLFNEINTNIGIGNAAQISKSFIKRIQHTHCLELIIQQCFILKAKFGHADNKTCPFSALLSAVVISSQTEGVKL
jgi:hypothetical protein